MTWYVWVIIAGLALNVVATILGIGKPRSPLTPANAVGVTIINGLIVWGIVSLATGGCS